ncbi:MAG: sensor domain-containing diguanylate cyclase [Rhizobium sp.]|nr:sensor domain-containing diguanylate cyclase [Rhizobium sp.]
MSDMNESERLEILRQYNILDTPAEPAFERIATLTKLIFDVPVVLISLVDEKRQWFKSAIGLDTRETPRNQAFCNETIRSDHVLVIRNTETDHRTAQNPLVTGDPFIRFYAGAPLVTPDRARLGSLCVIDRAPREFNEREQQILATLADLAMNELSLRRQTERDWPTGAVSRGTFQALATKLFETEARSTSRSGLISFDIDHFKQFNDLHGHLAGDKVLVEVVKTCQSGLRDGDILSRVGGEEFTILLPNVSDQVVATIAERLRLAIEALRFPELDLDIRVTASFGATLLNAADLTVEQTLQRADDALYRAKAAGRNRVAYA